MEKNQLGICATCHWFEGDRENDELMGHCHYDSPSMAGFPCIYPDNWCGDHKDQLKGG
jgi:hypothetical protein